MKELIYKNKAVIRFLVIFFGSYLLLASAYKLYLTYGSSSVYYPDFITHLVAKQSEVVIDALGYETVIVPHFQEPSIKIYVNRRYVARIVEGCNGVSVMVLFVSFVLSFYAKFKKTLFFLFAGSVIIYGLNIIRIALFSIALYEYPTHKDFLHDIIFPAMIYGVVFMLWVFWVRNVTREIKD